MIAYNYDISNIRAAVAAYEAGWLGNAEDRTSKLITLQKFEETSSIWSDIKPVFMELQHQKCIFCERQFETMEYGRIEHDLEHFRPKSSVKSWPPAGWPTTHRPPLGEPSSKGYYWLAYNLMNYAVACKVCNTPLKSDFFPIAGNRAKDYFPIAGHSEKAIRAYDRMQRKEKPYLCYPIGSIDDDPETLVTFVATTAVPAAKSGHKKRRGEIIIDFFQLNERLQLHRERARMIALLGGSLKLIEARIDVGANRKVVANLQGAHIPHSACLRAFRRTWQADRGLAKRMHNICQVYAVSVEKAKPPTFQGLASSIGSY
jgi:hypothetical protein